MTDQTEPIPPPPTEPPDQQILGAAPDTGAPAFAQVAPQVFNIIGVRPAEAQAVWPAACRVGEELTKTFVANRTVALDPMTIAAIVAIIVEAIKFYKQCRQSPAQVVADAREHRFAIGARVRRWKLRLIVEAKITDDDIRKDALRDSVADAIIACAAQQSDADVATLFAMVR